MSEDLSSLSSEPSLESLQAGQKSLCRVINVILLALIILTGSLFVFFLREVSVARRQVRELSQFVAEYERASLPVVREFRTRLQAFARTNADFAPVLARYFSPTNQAAGGAAPAARPASPAPPAPQP